MYVLFAVLVSLLIYGLLLLATRLARGATVLPGHLALRSAVVLGAALIAFSLASRAVGVDLGPLHPATYDIPNDYLARGALGIAALLPYTLACLSPTVALALIRR